MLSKWFPWDFFKNNPDVLDMRKPGIYALEVFDPFLERMITFTLKSKCSKLNYLSGQELTPDWLSQQFQELDLFSFAEESKQNPNFWFVLNSDEIPRLTRQKIIDNEIDTDENFLILSFTKKSTLFEELSKLDHVQSLKMEEPRFWETSKYLGFLETRMGMDIDSGVHQYILDAVENDTQSFVEALSKLRRFSTSWKSNQMGEVKKLIFKSRLDQFQLATIFSKKRKLEFYKSLIQTETDFDSFRSLFAFMQGHLIKLMDTSYIAKKKRPSKYDKEIDTLSKVWDSDELQEELKNFAALEILAKQKSPELHFQLRNNYFHSL